MSSSRFALLASLAFLVLHVAIPAEAQLDRLRKLRKDTERAQGDNVPMASIPAGEFWMGVDGPLGLEDERPRHRVWLDPYAMDVYEVTTGRYAGFLIANGHGAPWQWESVNLQHDGDRPVIGVDWHDAEAYCRWTGKRLPTEAEWERAARGTDERRYPWGNQDPSSKSANYALGARFSYSQVLMPVGHYESGKSAAGLYDMAGNVWEWVQDWYSADYYEESPDRNPPGPTEGMFKVLRGGAWSELPKYLLTYGRFKLSPTTRNAFTGFRCAKNVKGDG